MTAEAVVTLTEEQNFFNRLNSFLTFAEFVVDGLAVAEFVELDWW